MCSSLHYKHRLPGGKADVLSALTRSEVIFVNELSLVIGCKSLSPERYRRNRAAFSIMQ